VYYAAFALGLVVLAQIVLLVRVGRALGPLAHLEGRVSRLAEAVSLLTDTAETGFRALGERAQEPAVAKVARRQGRPAKATNTGRVVRAARRGKTVAEIAAAEQVSEGEVRLRLSLADAAGRETRHGSMRLD